MAAEQDQLGKREGRGRVEETGHINAVALPCHCHSSARALQVTIDNTAKAAYVVHSTPGQGATWVRLGPPAAAGRSLAVHRPAAPLCYSPLQLPAPLGAVCRWAPTCRRRCIRKSWQPASLAWEASWWAMGGRIGRLRTGWQCCSLDCLRWLDWNHTCARPAPCCLPPQMWAADLDDAQYTFLTLLKYRKDPGPYPGTVAVRCCRRHHRAAPAGTALLCSMQAPCWHCRCMTRQPLHCAPLPLLARSRRRRPLHHRCRLHGRHRPGPRLRRRCNRRHRPARRRRPLRRRRLGAWWRPAPAVTRPASVPGRTRLARMQIPLTTAR